MVDYFSGKRDVADLDARSLSAIKDFLSNIFKRGELDERSAAAIGQAVAEGLIDGVAASGAEAAVDAVVDYFNSKRGVEERSAAAIGQAVAEGVIDGVSASGAEAAVNAVVGYFHSKRDVEERSAAAIGQAVAEGVIDGVSASGAEAAVNAVVDYFHSKRELEARSGAAIGKAIAGSAAVGAIEAGVTSLVNKFTGRAVGDIFVDDTTGIIYADVDDAAADEKRAVGAIVSGLVTGTGAGILKTIYNDLTDRDVEKRSGAVIGKAIAGSAAVGAIEAGVTSLVNKFTGRAVGDIYLDDSTGIIYADMDDAAAGEKRAVGAIVSGLVTGAGGGVLKSIYNDLTSRSINELD